MYIIIYTIYYVVLYILCSIVPNQVDKMRAKLANLNNFAVPFLSLAVAKLCWYY